jgi:hypothetical protein
MKESTAAKLKIGERVYHRDHGVTGRVVEQGYQSVKIEWDDGQTGITHHSDMARVDQALEPLGVGL